MLGAPLLLAAADEYQISRSVRLRGNASAYFTRTPSTTTNRRTWTWSGWRKRGTLGGDQMFFEAQSGTTFSRIGIDGNINFFCVGGTSAIATTFGVISSAVIRDPSAWYHFVVSFDTTQATASNRVRLYINGVQVSSFATANYPNQNTDWSWNAAGAAHHIGRYVDSTYGAGGYFDGYVTEDIFVDGQALTPSSFGEFDATTGVWKPKKYMGTYGTNGHYLNFADNSAATAAAIGKDSSGNGNNWTPVNISMSAGSSYDSMLDVPTMWADGGNGRGNYCTLNPLAGSVVATYVSFSEGNLRATNLNSGAGVPAGGTIMVSSGKWYAEIQVLVMGPNTNTMGITSNVNDTNALGNAGGTVSYGYVSNGNKRSSAGSAAYGASWGVNDIIGIALDMDGGTVTFYKNGVSQGVAFSGLTGNYTFAGDQFGNGSIAFNFGQRPFSYTPPSGFKALHTGNLPDAVIRKGNAYFDASLYTGNGGSITVANGGFQPDLVWIKGRSSAFDHKLVDAVRGASGGIYYDLSSNSSGAESLPGAGVNGLTSNGFTIGGGTNNGYNGNGTTFVAWQWKRGVTPGFDIVTYAGTGSPGTGVINHSLGVAPSMVIIKQRNSGTANWMVKHRSLSSGQNLYLNGTNAQFAANSLAGGGIADLTSSTQFGFISGTAGVGDYVNNVNGGGGNYVAYLFSEVAGFSRFGSYTGNGSADGPFVFTGFRARFILLRRTDAAANWYIFDTARNTFNVIDTCLFPNLSNGDVVSSGLNMDILSNGFKLRNTDTDRNLNGATYIYAAFAESPFKYALAR